MQTSSGWRLPMIGIGSFYLVAFAQWITSCEVHLFSTSPNSHQCPTEFVLSVCETVIKVDESLTKFQQKNFACFLRHGVCLSIFVRVRCRSVRIVAVCLHYISMSISVTVCLYVCGRSRSIRQVAVCPHEAIH